MPNYRYKAFNDEGRYVNGKILAENPGELASYLRDNSLELISFKEESVSSFTLLGKVNSRDLIGIFIHLEQLEKAGVSIIDSVSDLKDNGDSQKVKNLMHEVFEAIKKGSLLSESFAKRPDVFDKTYIGLIAMGEKTGNIGGSLISIIEDIKWNLDIKRKTKKAIVGPSFGIFMMFVVITVMTTYVVPKVTNFLTTQGIDIPYHTELLIGFSNFMQDYWHIIILFIPVTWITLKLLARIENIGIEIDHIKLRIPIIGPIVTKIDSAKFCQFFAMTFKSGLGVLECLEAASGVMKNLAMKRSIAVIRQQVSEGQSLAQSIAATGYFPGLVTRMFKVGEESGNMEDSLKNIKFFYDREINDSIDSLVSMIQPTITLTMGGMILWITMAVFGPIYGTFANIG
jgi:type IV pilus assembly protein PilC